MDEREIRQLLELQVEAWNRSDIASFCSFYAEDAVYLRGADTIVGREALEAAYAPRLDADHATLALDITSVEVLGDAAFAVVEWGLGAARGHALLGLRRGPEGWLVAYDATLA